LEAKAKPASLCSQYSQTPVANATIPGEIHQHLKHGKVLKHDPLYRLESISQNWTAFETQSYETSITEVHSNVTTDNVVLYLEKVGTIADIYINGYWIATVDNIYRDYYFDINVPMSVKPNLPHVIQVEIHSTIRDSYLRAANYTKGTTEDYYWSNIWITPSWVQ
jgi:beta-galactosidase/beta-glucuronidase